MFTLPQNIQTIYNLVMGGMGALATILGVFDILLSMFDRMAEGINNRRERHQKKGKINA